MAFELVLSTSFTLSLGVWIGMFLREIFTFLRNLLNFGRNVVQTTYTQAYEFYNTTTTLIHVQYEKHLAVIVRPVLTVVVYGYESAVAIINKAYELLSQDVRRHLGMILHAVQTAIAHVVNVTLGVVQGVRILVSTMVHTIFTTLDTVKDGVGGFFGRSTSRVWELCFSLFILYVSLKLLFMAIKHILKKRV